MLEQAIGQAVQPPDPAVEVCQLADRAAAFAAIGNWPETLSMAEADLLFSRTTSIYTAAH